MVRYLLLALLLVGCGYKPMSHYTASLLGPRVYTKVKVYLRDPQNAVLIKDAVNKALYERLGSTWADRKSATSQLLVRVQRITFTPLEYDRYGYIIYYRARSWLEFDFIKDGKKRTITTEGFYDFPIEPNSVITDALRFIAIKHSAAKAIDRFISRLAYMGEH